MQSALKSDHMESRIGRPATLIHLGDAGASLGLCIILDGENAVAEWQGALDRKRRACRALGIGVFFKGVPGHEFPTALDLRALP